MYTPEYLGAGIGLRPDHYEHILEHKPKTAWFEIISENYMIEGGKPLMYLDKVRQDYPLVMHGVSMSLGSTDPLNPEYFKKLKQLIDRVEPCWVSDHLCWAGVMGRYAHDLLPMPYTQESLDHMVRRIQEAQEILGCQIALENPSSYVSFSGSGIPEWEFMAEMANQADCGILLDINNVFVSAFNHEFDAHEYIQSIPKERVWQFHLAGHQDHSTHLLDTHDHPVRDEVWDLFGVACDRFGKVSTLIEWDDAIPEFQELQRHADKAQSVLKGCHET